MLAKSFAAIVGGCLVSISLMLNLNYILPLEVDTKLLIGVLLGFPLWVFTMVWCYGSKGGKQAWKRCISVLLVSVGINTLFVLG